MPLRHAAMPGHDARAEALSRHGRARAALERRVAVAQLAARRPGLALESSARPDRPTPTCSSACAADLARRACWSPSTRPAGAAAWAALARRARRLADLLARAAARAAPTGPGLSLAVGVALADALDPRRARSRIGLKWPNDLWLLDAPGPAASSAAS